MAFEIIAFANAQSAQPGADPGLMSFLPLVVVFIVFWFLLIRPQMKKAKEQKIMIDSLQKGDEIVTTGGVLGKIQKVDDSFILLDAGLNCTLWIQKNSVSLLLPKGTIRSLD